MRPALRLFAAVAAVAPCLLAMPVAAGQFLPQGDCDTLSVPGHTVYDFFIWKHFEPSICTVELRARDYHDLPRADIVAWEMPEGWTAEWIPNESGAIVIRGCLLGNQEISPVLRVTMPGRAGCLASRFFDQAGTMFRSDVHVFWCGSIPVPAAPATWGRVKVLYR